MQDSGLGHVKVQYAKYSSSTSSEVPLVDRDVCAGICNMSCEMHILSLPFSEQLFASVICICGFGQAISTVAVRLLLKKSRLHKNGGSCFCPFARAVRFGYNRVIFRV
jgi:hypothetical protein